MKVDKKIRRLEMKYDKAKKFKRARKPQLYLTCRVCGHNWLPRIPNPRICPNCGNKNWR